MTLSMVLLAGVMLAGGVACLVIALVRTTPRLADALARIAVDTETSERIVDVARWTEAAGCRVMLNG